LTEPNLKPGPDKDDAEEPKKKKPTLSSKKIEFSRPQTALITSPKSPQINVESLRLAQLRPQTPLSNIVAKPLTSKAVLPEPGSMSNRQTTAPTTVSTREKKPILKPSSAFKRDNITPLTASDRHETQVSFGAKTTTERERRLKTNTSNLTIDSRADLFSEVMILEELIC